MAPEQAPAEPGPQSSSTQPAQTAAPGPTENVDRIREILFGSQMREYDLRFAQLEERLLRETTELRSEIRRRLDSLEVYARQELESLSDRQNTERAERRESLDRLSRDLGEATRTLERRMIQTDEQASKDLRELRQMTMDRQRALADELTQCIGKSEITQTRRLEELRADSVDRLALANLMAELALRLRGEFRVPGIEGAANAGAGQ